MTFVACARCTALDVLCSTCYQEERKMIQTHFAPDNRAQQILADPHQYAAEAHEQARLDVEQRHAAVKARETTHEMS